MPARSKSATSAKSKDPNGGQFHTPSSVVRPLLETLPPCKGRVYDPACGSGGNLYAYRLRRDRSAQLQRATAHGGVPSEKFLEAHGGKPGDVSIYGRDKRARRKRSFGPASRARSERLGGQPKLRNATTQWLSVMNLAIRGIQTNFGTEHADTFRRDIHPGYAISTGKAYG